MSYKASRPALPVVKLTESMVYEAALTLMKAGFSDDPREANAAAAMAIAVALNASDEVRFGGVVDTPSVN